MSDDAPPIPFLIDGTELSDGVAQCLSGGGYRAMLFHAGAIWRLNELGLLPTLDMVSGVSGGALASGALAAAWSELRFDQNGRADNLRESFLLPVLRQSEDAIDAEAIAISLLPWESAFPHITSSLQRNLTRGGTALSDLPDRPSFVFNTTSLMTGRDLRFSKALSADYRVGTMNAEALPLASAMAASAAFPPYLSPAEIDLTPFAVTFTGKEDLHRPPFTEKAVLCDGGVYDNLGLEPAWKRYRTLLVSDAGRPFDDLDAPPTDWLGQLRRVLDITMNQDQALRERILIYAYRAGHRSGALWTLGVHAEGRPPLLTDAELIAAKAVRTRLNAFTADEQTLLLKSGYAHAEWGIRKHYAAAAEISAEPGQTPPTP